jgi:hypothetical protein
MPVYAIAALGPEGGPAALLAVEGPDVVTVFGPPGLAQVTLDDLVARGDRHALGVVSFSVSRFCAPKERQRARLVVRVNGVAKATEFDPEAARAHKAKYGD